MNDERAMVRTACLQCPRMRAPGCCESEGGLWVYRVTTFASPVPHHGPITTGCPVECLQWVMSQHSFNRLARAYDAPFDPPRTVGDVLDLHVRHALGEISGLGPRRLSEIETTLVRTELDLARHETGMLPPAST